MSLLTKPLFAAALIVVIQPALSTFLLWRAMPGLIVIPHVEPDVVLKPAGARPPWDMWTPEVEKLADELKKERETLKARETEVAQAEARILAERAELARTRQEIERQRGEISKLLTEVSADEAKNLKNLAKTYSQLTPKAAMAIFGEMDDTTVVKILSQMKADVVVPIFEEMSKDKSEKNNQAQRAAVLSERLRLMKSQPAPGS